MPWPRLRTTSGVAFPYHGGGPVAAGPGGDGARFADEFPWRDPTWLTDLDALERSCRSYLEILRWPEGVHCPRCGSAETGRIEVRRKFYCRGCRYQFSVTAGTCSTTRIFRSGSGFSRFRSCSSPRRGIPSNQLLQLLGGSYKTAWFAQHRVRTAIGHMERADNASPNAGGANACARSVRAAVADRLASTEGRDTRFFDRPIVGAYHQLSVKHAPAYAAEMEWRSKCRENPWAFRDTILSLLAADPLEFAELIAGPTPSRSHYPVSVASGDGGVSQDQ